MINSYHNIYKICEQKLKITTPEEKRKDCLEAFGLIDFELKGDTYVYKAIS